MGLAEEELAVEPSSGSGLLLWVGAGLGFLIVVVALILASQRIGRGEGRKA
jgi:hypothetical protein